MAKLDLISLFLKGQGMWLLLFLLFLAVGCDFYQPNLGQFTYKPYPTKKPLLISFQKDNAVGSFIDTLVLFGVLL